MRIWSLFRHGSRLPGGETIAGMRTRLKNLRLAILLKHWEQTKNSSTPDEEGRYYIILASYLLANWKIIMFIFRRTLLFERSKGVEIEERT